MTVTPGDEPADWSQARTTPVRRRATIVARIAALVAGLMFLLAGCVTSGTVTEKDCVPGPHLVAPGVISVTGKIPLQAGRQTRSSPTSAIRLHESPHLRHHGLESRKGVGTPRP